MLSHVIRYLFALFCMVACSRAIDVGPVQLLPSSNFYGPDGPWQAINVSLGDPPQSVQLLPGGIYQSLILSNGVCSGSSLPQPCGVGGLYNIQNSNTADNTSIQMVPNIQSIDGGATQSVVTAISITEQLQIPRIGNSPWNVPNLSIALVENISISFPSGSGGYPAELGSLALGSAINQSFTLGSGSPDINASLIPGWFFAQEKVIAANTYGLHIGSAALGIPLSLWLGGYDRSRVLGPVSSQAYSTQDGSLVIDLLDIEIGVDNGASPFNFSERRNILNQGNSSIGESITVSMNSLAPYLHLPKSVCDAIASYLPVSYQSKYGLYLWNTNDPHFKPIITSPSYLSFIFRATNLQQPNITIKVPFQLLNLTLQAPITNKPTQYFPCRPPSGGGEYTLGRAFLQAAFLGVIWDPQAGLWFLAQAPGPNTAQTSQQVPLTTTVSGSSNSWSDSWTGHWTPIKETTSTVNATNSTVPEGPTTTTAPPAANSSSPGGLSTGAKAGIGVGCAAAVATIIAVALFVYRSRSHARLASAASSHETPNAMGPDGHNNIPLKGYYAPPPPPPEKPLLVEAPGPEPAELVVQEPLHEIG